MIRKIIKIDEDRCNGCGLCVSACHEGAIGLVDGKAKLLRDDYCDGLGNCLPACPTGAITFEEREAAAFDEAAVKANMEVTGGTDAGGATGAAGTADVAGAASASGAECATGAADAAGAAGAADEREPDALPCGCPGTHSKSINREPGAGSAQASGAGHTAEPAQEPGAGHAREQAKAAETHLNQWPVQIKLVPVNAPYFNNANLLIAADCAAYAYGGFHGDFMKNRITIIGCPKLDDADYSEKLTAILAQNDIKSVTVARMEVPCCGGIEHATKTALQNCGKLIPWQVVVFSTDGKILEASLD